MIDYFFHKAKLRPSRPFLRLNLLRYFLSFRDGNGRKGRRSKVEIGLSHIINIVAKST